MTQPPSIIELIQKFEALKNEWNSKKRNRESCSDKIKDVTTTLTRCSFLPKEGKDASEKELFIARETLEIACFLSLEQENIPSFESYIAQLKPYYYDYKVLDVHQSSAMYELLGLNLLRLLAQNKLAAFHTELERLPIDKITKDKYIMHPVSLEQYLMEGNFEKVFLSRANVPSKRYEFFIDILLNTTRNEVALCIEEAYENLSLDEARRMLFFDDQQTMLNFGQERKWNLTGDVYHFKKETEDKVEKISPIEVAGMMLDYTKELDQII